MHNNPNGQPSPVYSIFQSFESVHPSLSPYLIMKASSPFLTTAIAS